MSSFCLTVTQEDIDKGRPKSAQSCPVACALYRLTGNHYDVYLDAFQERLTRHVITNSKNESGFLKEFFV